jgi:hypothetical protein
MLTVLVTAMPHENISTALHTSSPCAVVQGTIAEAMTRQPDAFFGCEWGPGGEVIVNTFLAANYYLKALVGDHSST